MSVVVDASVACKWFLPEKGSDEALAVLMDDELLAPEVIFFEVGNVLWKRVRAEEITEQEADTVLAKLVSIPFVLADTRVLAGAALAIATQYGRSFYDSAYLALARLRGTTMITADERLVNSLAGTELASHIRLLGS